KGELLSFGNYPNPVEGVHTTTFSVKGTLPVDEMRVEIYNFSGKLVYDSGWGPNDLDWHLQNDAGDVLANGVYYYRILVRFIGQDKPVVSGLQKLAIYR
ncbi:MAG: T9SS type A sorting domain-containing protein, partial [Dehalococcoidia bacterium]|nr:T9SS type A sorting domain-containing protein [Dehalococcoidia bacterium]